MAGIIKRFKDIMSANINALLDKAEDPEKMVDQYLRDMESDLGKVKAETAAVMAEEKRAKRELDECSSEIEKMQKYAEKALAAGNEDDARKFLEKKIQLTQQREADQQVYDSAAANAVKMREMHDKLTKDIASLNERKASIKAKMAAAKAQQRMNDLTVRVGNVHTGDSMSAFDRMEAKANQMLDQANAMAELNASSAEDTSVEELKKKYDAGSGADVDAELEELKKKMGL